MWTYPELVEISIILGKYRRELDESLEGLDNPIAMILAMLHLRLK